MSRSLLGGPEHQITHANGEIPAGAIIIISKFLAHDNDFPAF